MKKIIQKVLQELKSENPKLDYIRGLLEAIAEEDKVEYIPPTFMHTTTIPTPYQPISAEIDEAEVLEAKTKAHIAKHGMPKIENE